MAVIKSVDASSDWASVNAATGIAVGTAMELQNLTAEGGAYLQESSSKPTAQVGFLLTRAGTEMSGRTVDVGSAELWVKSAEPFAVRLAVQEQ